MILDNRGDNNNPHYSPIRILVKGGKTISIIGTTMFNIVATIIIVLQKKLVFVKGADVKKYGVSEVFVDMMIIL